MWNRHSFKEKIKNISAWQRLHRKLNRFFGVLLAHRHESKWLGLGGVSGCNPLLKVVPLWGLNISFNLKLSHSGTGLCAFCLVHLIRYPCEKLCAGVTKQHQFRDPCPWAALPCHSKATSPALTPLHITWAVGLSNNLGWETESEKNKDFFPLCGSLLRGICSLIQVTVQAPKVWSGSSEELAERKEKWQETAHYRQKDAHHRTWSDNITNCTVPLFHMK